MNNPRRVLCVITTLDVGGAEKHLLWLVGGLRERGHSVDVVYLKGEGRLASNFADLGAAVTKVSFEGVLQAPGAVRGIRRQIVDGNYDLVHSHLLKADALAALACRPRGMPPLIQSKHNEEPALRNSLVSRIHGALSRIPGRVIALSDHVLDYVATTGRVDRGKLRRIYYGIDPAPFAGGNRAEAREALGLAPETHAALCVARFHPQKDHATLFRAARRLKDEGRNFRLYLAGGDPFYGHERRARALVSEMALDDNVVFLGIRDDIPALLAASDLFVLTSLYEGLGLVFLEAMAASRPVLATRSSAIPEVIRDGETGLLAEVGDDEAIASCWGRLMDHREEGEGMGRAGRIRVEEVFSLPRMLDEILSVYGDVMTRRP